MSSVQETVAIVLSNHHQTTGMAVSMGWTCVCGWHTDSGRVIGGGYLAGAYEHMAAVLSEYGLLAAEQG